MISPSGNFRIFLAAEPVDFRKGMDGLAACVANNFDLDPYSGAIYVFRSRRADRLKLLVWDGSGLVLIMKRLNGKRFTWPKPQSGPVTLTKVQFNALFEGIDWTKVAVSSTRKPVFISPRFPVPH
ncbi:IS66 family insertion sequence element accessory protein TnpB [Antarcticimicrobium luteum]|uniref:IS66 family insertion sequence element accessory protein TnpB n=1 Tax=Antarcticimicrobium luteum TaxID=2547397 RepID=A0A4V6PM99_9RHOB|nr:IS66 family insertion sequence element accessory protein TnpB [Antarcticimicrobium luteum]TDK50350.1 IS66 family insertion sequence element accessory protein TnpB [Antarcticimicrobium luteum]